MRSTTIWAAVVFAISMTACYERRPDAVYVGHDHHDYHHDDNDHHDERR
jgi:hypothetical protein